MYVRFLGRRAAPIEDAGPHRLHLPVLRILLPLICQAQRVYKGRTRPVITTHVPKEYMKRWQILGELARPDDGEARVAVRGCG